jgi:NACalpha-BTF3-like transcription factor
MLINSEYLSYSKYDADVKAIVAYHVSVNRNDADSHDEIRQTIVSYIESNAEYFKLFMEDDESIEQYITKMKSCNEWGGHQELYAASQCFDTNIVIHQLNSPDYIIQANSVKSNSTTTIHLSYHGECHYNSVIMIDHITGGDTDADVNGTADKSEREFNDGVIDLVALSVPWVDRENVMSALSSNDGDVDAAVDWLCTHMSEHCGVVAKDEGTHSDGATTMASNDFISTISVHNDATCIRSVKQDVCGGLLIHPLNDHDEKDSVIDAIPDSMDESSATKVHSLDRDRMGHTSSAASIADSKRRGGKIKSRPDAREYKEVTSISTSVKAVTTTLSKKVFMIEVMLIMIMMIIDLDSTQ